MEYEPVLVLPVVVGFVYAPVSDAGILDQRGHGLVCDRHRPGAHPLKRKRLALGPAGRKPAPAMEPGAILNDFELRLLNTHRRDCAAHDLDLFDLSKAWRGVE